MSQDLKKRGVSALLAGWACVLGLSLLVNQARHAIADSAAQRSALLNRHRAALDALRRNDLAALSRLAHPSRGVQFSPGVYVHSNALKFSPRQLRGLPARGRLVWGRYDGTGLPISLNWTSYRKAFVWSRDFRRAHQSVNQFAQRGNSRNNLRAAFPRAAFVESYIPATQPGGSDWSALWTAWARQNNVWKLVGVAHDAWTI